MLLATLKEQGKEGTDETQDLNTDKERLGYPQPVVEMKEGLGQRGL